MKKASVFIFCILFSGIFLCGNIYFWTDKNGIKHFSNTTLPFNEPVKELEESTVVFKKLVSHENQKQEFEVLSIFDGDTIKVKGLDLIFTIRLAGIDCPEIGYNGQDSQPFAHKAKQHLADRLDNKKVTIKSYGVGGYNRQLAEIFVKDQNINLEMIRQGLAEVYPGKKPKNFDSKMYFEEEVTAKKTKKGIWSQGRSYKSPRQWRTEHPRK